MRAPPHRLRTDATQAMWFIVEERRLADDPAPPATRRADGGCGPISAALLPSLRSGQAPRYAASPSRRATELGTQSQSAQCHVFATHYTGGADAAGDGNRLGRHITFVKNILGRIAPEPFIFLRFTLAGLILMLVTVPSGRVTRDLIRPGIILGLLVFAGYWLQTHGLMLISPSRSAFLTGLCVVMVPFCDALVYRVRVSFRAWAGSVLALIGTAAMIGGFDARPSVGDALTVACAAIFAFHVILPARFSARYSATGLAAVQVLVVGLAAAPASAFAPRPQFTRETVIFIIFTAIVTTALAFAALMWAQAHVSATEAAVILAFEPLAAALTSIIWYHEPLTIAFVAGAPLILCAMIVSQTSATIQRDGPNPRHQ